VTEATEQKPVFEGWVILELSEPSPVTRWELREDHVLPAAVTVPDEDDGIPY
jgi:hypothetical protein